MTCPPKEPGDILADIEDRLRAIRITRLDSPEAIHQLYMRDCFDPTDLEAGEEYLIGGVGPDGEDVEVTVDQMLDGMREAGVWGFADDQNHQINCWLDPTRLNLAQVIHFFAHEYTHLVPAPEYPQDPQDPELAEELFCEYVGQVAAAAYSAAAIALTSALGQSTV